MANLRILSILISIAVGNAYIIKFDLLGYESIFGSDDKVKVAQINNQYPNVDWATVEVPRVTETLQYTIPGLVGCERCFNIIPPIFSGGTPAVTTKDLLKPHNLIEGQAQQYFYPDTLLNPQQQLEKPSLEDKFPYLRLGLSSPLPKAEITKVSIESRLDPETIETLGAAGPPPLAIALYARRDCRSRSMNHSPDVVIRFFEGEGLQFVNMNTLFPGTGILEAQSWEELDGTSEWWANAIGETLIQPKDRTTATSMRQNSSGSDQTANSNDTDERYTPTRTYAGEAYVSGPDNRHRKDVVEIGDFEFYTIEEVMDSIQTMNALWPGLEDYGYAGPTRLDPQVKPTGSEYESEGWLSNTAWEKFQNSGSQRMNDQTEGLAKDEEEDSEGDIIEITPDSSTEEIDPGYGGARDMVQSPVKPPPGLYLYNPLRQHLPRERKEMTSATFKEDESDESDMPPLLAYSSSSDGSVPPLEDIPGLRPQISPLDDAEALEELDLFRARSGGNYIDQGQADNVDVARDGVEDEDWVNPLDELE